MDQVKIKPHPLSQFDSIVMGIVLLGFGILCGRWAAWILTAIPVGIGFLIAAWYNVASRTYLLSATGVIIRSGVFSLSIDEVEFFRVKDIIVYQSFINRFFDIGSISLISSDPSHPTLEIYGIAHPEPIRKFLREAFHTERERKDVKFMDLFQDNGR